ncbi:MAG: flavodoxin [Gammaproteobacteria bacterium]|nr:MAG: flavodoxin [Gammaproteobacteria bacterium]
MIKVLIVNGYETLDQGEAKLSNSISLLSKQLFLDKGYEVKTTIVEQGYSSQVEYEKFDWADKILIHFPVYWFAVPGLFKTYLDTILLPHKFFLNDGRSRKDPSKKYGSGGLMKSKKYMLCSTWNAPKTAFGPEDELFQGKSVDDVLISTHLAMQFCGLTQIESFHFHDVFKGDLLTQQVKEFEEHIKVVF